MSGMASPVPDSPLRPPPSGAAQPIDWAKTGFQAAVVGALLVVLFWNVLQTLLYKWQNMGDWSHGFLIPVFSLYYLYLQKDRLPTWSVRASYGGLVVLLAAFGIYVYSTAIAPFSYLQSVSLVLAIVGVVYMLCGWAVTRWAWFAIAFLVFALPLPGGMYEQITTPLQRIASAVGAVLLKTVPDLETEAANVTISYYYRGREGELNVDQACSGIRLMMAFAALGVAMAFVSERRLWHRMVMVLSCVPIAIFCNMVRVTTTGLFVVFGKEDWARGHYHTMLGLSMLPIAFALFGAVSYVLNHLFVEAQDEDAAAPRTRPAARQESEP